MVIVIDNASLLIATTYKMGMKGLLYAYWSIITITFFYFEKKNCTEKTWNMHLGHNLGLEWGSSP